MSRPRLALVLADEPPHVPIERLLAAQPVDVVLCLGDLRAEDLAPLASFSGRKLGVHGNHDLGTEFTGPGIEELHLRVVDLGGLRFGGFGGSVRYRPGPRWMWTQEQAAKLLAAFAPVDVLLSHSPPLGCNDDAGDRAHAGLRGLAEYVERVSPALLLHGHTYPAVPTNRLGATRVRYVRGHAFVELPAVGVGGRD